MLDTSPLTLGYDGKPVLRIGEFALAKGEACLLVGPSGCGKTTMLHTIAGLIRPLDGHIRIDSTEITALSEAKRDRFRGRHVGMIFQSLYLMPSLSVLDNLRLAAYAAGLPDAAKAGQALLARLGLADKAHALPDALSQGQQQRVAIARAVINRPSLILADEPTSALDDASCDRVIGLIRDVAAESGAALLISTHDARLKPHFARIVDLEAAP